MCDCIKTLHEKLHDTIHRDFAKHKRPVQHFSIRTTMTGKAVVNINIDLEKQMKPVETFIVADFCPWCGVKYDA